MADTPPPVPEHRTTPTEPGSDSPDLAHAEPSGGQSLGPASLTDFGRYKDVRPLARGGMGIVYHALDTMLGREVAIKLLPAERFSREAYERFEREARAAARLEHPNIVRVYEVERLPVQLGGLPYYTMELLHGETLAEAIHGGRVRPRMAAETLRQVARAVAFAHQRGILHRDIKPANIWLRGQGAGTQALLLDFGLAKLVEHDASLDAKRDDQPTQDGSIVGTPEYMAPEQVRGGKDVDVRTDVYGLGAALYHSLTGVPPFHEESNYATYRAVEENAPVPPRKKRADIHLDLESICLKCLEKDPGRRYQTAEALAEDLAKFQSGEPVHARPVGPMGRFVRRVRRHPLVSSLVSLDFHSTRSDRIRRRARAADAQNRPASTSVDATDMVESEWWG